MKSTLKKTESILLKVFIRTTVTTMMVIVTVLLTLISMLIHSIEFKQESSKERSDYLAAEKEKIRSRVEIALNLIRHEQAQRDSLLKELLRSEVYKAYDVAQSLQKVYGIFSSEGVVQNIVESIRPLRFNGNRGYFFMTDHNGVELLFADRPELEGENLFQMKSGDGKMVIQDMIALSKSAKKEGFYHYNWSKPGTSGMNHPKIAFVKQFEPLNCFIGTGEYIDEYEKIQKRAILETLEAMNDSVDSYIFAGQWDGLALLGPAKGKNTWDATDFDGVKVMQELVALSKKGGGFLEYRVPQGYGDPIKKLSYVLAVPEWGWYIGSGVSIDRLEVAMAKKEKSYFIVQIGSILLSCFLLAAMIVLVRLFLNRYFSKIDSDISNLTDFFARTVNGAVPSIAHDLRFQEFEQISHCADAMVVQREKIQEQLHQSQKMEAVGQLAGGVAHDINNSLAGIMGATELIMEPSLSESDRNSFCQLILRATHRSAELTNQLLTFSRKKNQSTVPIDCESVVVDTVNLLKRTIDKTIEISIENHAQNREVIGDIAHLQSAFMNIGINASHAMKQGGKLVYTLENRILDETFSSSSTFDISPGEYLEIAISDTGCGMSSEIMQRIFEPFFTTKEQGKGTGLGLAAVYGTVQEHHGMITVDSTVGVGTVFHIYLPVSEHTEEQNHESAVQVDDTIGESK